jgi:expansin (peptidoglycan-binding protein)
VSKKVSAERVAELVKALEIPESITPADYPVIFAPTSGNIMFAISAASKAWRKVDVGVSNRFFSVVNANCQSEHEVDALIDAISAQ